MILRWEDINLMVCTICVPLIAFNLAVQSPATNTHTQKPASVAPFSPTLINRWDKEGGTLRQYP